MTIALLTPMSANAQAYQCRAPNISSVPQIAPDSRPRLVPTTGYTLALSWSPAFCRTRQDSRAHRTQCSGNSGRFGLIVHGLWPQGSRTWPQWCPTQERVTPRIARDNICMMPSERLIARQWAKHGSCMTRRPETYFRVTQILWNSLRIPDYDRISREDYAEDIRQAIALLSDQDRILMDELAGRMEAASDNLDFETAAVYFGYLWISISVYLRARGHSRLIEARLWRGFPSAPPSDLARQSRQSARYRGLLLHFLNS